MTDATNTLKSTDSIYPGGEGNRPPKMHPERKALWVAALRSGQYEQVSDMLRSALDETAPPKAWGYCCLGVACDVMDPKGWTVNKSEDYYGASYDNEVGALPRSVIRWLWDLPEDAELEQYGRMCDPFVLVVPKSGIAKRWVALSVLNDCYNWSFKRIADVIEEQL